MTQGQQIEAMVVDLTKVIDRYREEFDITFAATIGVLEVIKLDLYQEIRESAE